MRCPRIRVNGAGIATQADIKQRHVDGSVRHAVIATVIPSLPGDGTVTVTFQDQPCSNTPLSKEQMLEPAYDFDAAMQLAFADGTTGTASARKMLEAGDYKLWTSGPIAQTIELADDTATRKYDLGDGGGPHPFRPRFYATFWPTLKKVQVRFAGEAGLTTELMDLRYALILTLGRAAPRTVYSLDLTGGPASGGKLHWSMSGWTKRYWIGRAPEPKINIDHNLAWLAATQIVPNYDTRLKIPEAALKRAWDLHTTRLDGTARHNQPYDSGANGQSLWTAGMGTAGGRPDIGPYPDWAVRWLYSGDWRMREMSLTLADIAASWPMHIRESDPKRRLNRDDASGSGTGLGLPVSITDRETIITWTPSYIEWRYTAPSDRLVKVGSISESRPWSPDGAHQPAPFFVPYILTGDKYYLDEMAMWAAFSAGRYNFGVRGPTGAEGGIHDELRGGGWVVRSRAEVASVLPDGDPLKRYFEMLLIDALARWEGGLGVTGSALDGHPMKIWGVRKGNIYSLNSGPLSAKPPLLHNWESNGYPATPSSSITHNEKSGIYQPGKVGSFTSPWMQYFVLYALGRVKELGYPAEALSAYSSRWLVDMITKTGKPELVSVYQMPVEKLAVKGSDGSWASGGFFTWREILSDALTPEYLSMELPKRHKNMLSSVGEGYNWQVLPAISYAVEAGIPGAAAALAWYRENVYSNLVGLADNPKWAILPRSAR